jgi:hypothetical protein
MALILLNFWEILILNKCYDKHKSYRLLQQQEITEIFGCPALSGPDIDGPGRIPWQEAVMEQLLSEPEIVFPYIKALLRRIFCHYLYQGKPLQ